MRRPARVLPILVTSALVLALALLGTPAEAGPRPGTPTAVRTTGSPTALLAGTAKTPGLLADHRGRRSLPPREVATGRSRASAQGTATPADGTLAPVTDPGFVVHDPATQTLYVSDLTDGSIRIVDGRTCIARRPHCRAPVATFGSGPGLSYMLIDPRSRTLYVTYGGEEETGAGGGLVAYDLRRCQIRDTSGCGDAFGRTTLPLAAGLALDSETRTLVIGSFATSVWLVDAARCNGRTATGCQPVRTLTGGPEPLFVLVDRASRTLYVTNAGADTLSIFDLSACHVGTTSGCGRPPGTTRTGGNPNYAAIDRTGHTLYVSNGSGSVSVIDQRTCNARVTVGCSAEEPASIRAGLNPQTIEFSRSTPTMYVMTYGSDTIDVVDTRHCRARDTSACGEPHRSIQTASGEPWWMAFDPDTDSLWVTPITTGALQVLDARACSAVRASGCRREAPSTPGGGGNAIDPGRHTYYQTERSETGGKLRFIDTRTCNIARPAGCAVAVASAPLGDRPGSMAIDLGTATLYVADYGLRVLHVIDVTRCNVSRHDGCTPLASIPIPSIGIPELNTATHTVYVTQRELGTVAVIPGSRCNRSDVSGCGGPLLTVAAGAFTDIAWPDPSTNTVYVTNGDLGTVTLLNGAGCDRRDAECRAVASSVVGPVPVSLAFDPATHSAFTSIWSFGEEAGRVVVMDTRTCRASNTTGCGTRWPTTPTARGTLGATFVPQTRTLVTTNANSATISLIDTRRCNATDTSRCGRRSTEIAVGRFSVVSWADPSRNTLYVTNNFEQSTSLINLRHPCRSGLCFHA